MNLGHKLQYQMNNTACLLMSRERNNNVIIINIKLGQ